MPRYHPAMRHLRLLALPLLLALAGASLHAAAEIALPSPDDLGRRYRKVDLPVNASAAGIAAEKNGKRGRWRACHTDIAMKQVVSDTFSYPLDGPEAVTADELIAAVRA